MISVRLQPLSRELDLAIRNDLSPASRSKLIAETAREDILAIDRTNDAAAGTNVLFHTVVDGRIGGAFESVNPDRGTIAAVWQLGTDVVEQIGVMLKAHSPVLTGRYRSSHILFADGLEVDHVDPRLSVREWAYISGVPYARKIEKRSADGVYEGVAAIARSRFSNVAKISFTFRSLARGGGSALDTWARSTGSGRQIRNERRRAEWLRRQPAIVITIR